MSNFGAVISFGDAVPPKHKPYHVNREHQNYKSDYYQHDNYTADYSRRYNHKRETPAFIKDNQTGKIYVLEDVARRALSRCRSHQNEAVNSGYNPSHKGNCFPMNIYNSNNNFYKTDNSSYNPSDYGSMPQNWNLSSVCNSYMGQQMFQQETGNNNYYDVI